MKKATAVRVVEETRETVRGGSEDMMGLVEAIRELPKKHRVQLMALAY